MATVNIQGSGSRAFRISRMPEAGKYIITTIVWFQFVVAQLNAVVMLSTAISDEIHHRTLGLLMTTPINSFQIITGKLFSKLLQLILLLAVSMPLLAIIRVFGGVPWDYVISSLCITLTAAIFAGSISLFSSIHVRRAHTVIVGTALVCISLYAILPGLLRLLSFASESLRVPDFVLTHINPFVVMTLNTQMLLHPAWSTAALSWPLHCAVMAGGSALFLLLSTFSVRRAGLRQAPGWAGVFPSLKKRRTAAVPPAQTDSPAVGADIRHVKGPPVIWKEMKAPLIRGGRLKTIVAGAAVAVVLSFAYGYCAYEKCLGEQSVQMGFILVYFLLGLFGTATAAASSITSEKEAHTWPALLTTPLDEKQIVFGKIIGSVSRCRPFWLLLAAHLLVFSCLRYIHPIAILPLSLLVVSSSLLFASLGVFLSSCFKRTAPAAAINLILFFLFVVPCCCPLPTFFVSPLFIALAILGVAGGAETAAAPFYKLQYVFSSGIRGFLTSMLVLTGIMIIYLLIAFAFFAIAKGKVRRKVF
jgi:ABC-type transport system involved in multi-copper enzyme maturation permease subunit